MSHVTCKVCGKERWYQPALSSLFCCMWCGAVRGAEPTLKQLASWARRLARGDYPSGFTLPRCRPGEGTEAVRTRLGIGVVRDHDTDALSQIVLEAGNDELRELIRALVASGMNARRCKCRVPFLTRGPELHCPGCAPVGGSG